jgi:hypothetical protein
MTCGIKHQNYRFRFYLSNKAVGPSICPTVRMIAGSTICRFRVVRTEELRGVIDCRYTGFQLTRTPRNDDDTKQSTFESILHWYCPRKLAEDKHERERVEVSGHLTVNAIHFRPIERSGIADD